MSLVYLTPVLDRPQNVRPYLEAVHASTPDARVLFLADPGDDAELAAIEVWRDCLEARFGDLTIDVDECGGNYAAKINHGVETTDEPYIFLAADDLRPRPGWFEAARAKVDEGYGVVGVNDLIRRHRVHTTHFLLHREYAQRPTIDGERGPLCERYDHSFCDDELIGTATNRGQYFHELAAEVLHLHPWVGTAEHDATYERGNERYFEDKHLYRSRRALWT